MRIESRDQFETLRDTVTKQRAKHQQQILVCCGTGCLASGAKQVAEAFAEQVEERGLDAEVGLFVKPTGCHGFCERGPLVALQPSGILYTKVKAKQVAEILDTTVVGGEEVGAHLGGEPTGDLAHRGEQWQGAVSIGHRLIGEGGATGGGEGLGHLRVGGEVQVGEQRQIGT